jgi:predicted transposase YbfD/YdcC
MLSAAQMQSLPAFFREIPDPRRAQGRRHGLSTVLGIAAGAVLCGMRGYKAIADWAESLGQKARERFGCRRAKGRYLVPSESILRNVLIRVDPAHLDRALRRWNETYAGEDESLAIDGKTLCNALDAEGHPTHVMSVVGHQTQTCYTQKKVGTLPVEGREEVKRTNEIKMAIPLLEAIEIAGKDITGDALLTQRKFAEYLVEKRQAHYSFTVKGNQPGLLADLQFYFQDRGQAHFLEQTPPDHGRLETRKIWTTTELNDYLDFPHVGQAFLIERHVIKKKTGEYSREIAYGLTSRTPQEASPQRVLQVNRGHWVIENGCHYVLDWNFDEDRSRIRVGHGPENITRLRRFAIGVIKSRGARSVAQKMRQLTRNVRWVFDYLRMTENACASRTAN